MPSVNLIFKTVIITFFGWFIPYIVYKYYHFIISGVCVYLVLYFYSKNTSNFFNIKSLENMALEFGIKAIGKRYVNKLLPSTNLKDRRIMKIKELKELITKNNFKLPKKGTGTGERVVKRDLIKFVIDKDF